MTQVIESHRNGVDTEKLYATLDLLVEQPAAREFRFRAVNHWIDGAHNRATIQGFYGGGAEDESRPEPFEIDFGEPPILIGHNEGPNPAEGLLAALSACLTTSIVYVAAARKVRLTEVRSELEGEMNVGGALGLDDSVRNGFRNIKVTFHVKGDAPEEKLREVVERAKARSAVYDMVTNGVPVDVEAVTA